MPDWNQILEELNAVEAAARSQSTFDAVRRRYLKQLHDLTDRNVIVYYSGWLQKPNLDGTEINDEDKNGFMTALHELDHTKGLDLILHTPGGQTGATESIVDYLRSVCNTDIRAFVPQLALSGGTVIACGCKEIYMGKHSSLGPIDPQIGQIPAHGVLEEFERARAEIKADPGNYLVWHPILSRYDPAFIGRCQNALQMTQDMVAEWLSTGMFEGENQAIPLTDEKGNVVTDENGNQILTTKSIYIAHTADSDSRRPFVHLRRPLNLGLTFLTLQSHFPTFRLRGLPYTLNSVSLPLSKKKQTKICVPSPCKAALFGTDTTREFNEYQGSRKTIGKRTGQKAVRTGSKTDTFPHQTDSLHDQTDTFSSQMDKFSEETDTFHEHHANRKRGAGLELFLFISRLLASASLIGSRSAGGKSSCVVAS